MRAPVFTSMLLAAAVPAPAQQAVAPAAAVPEQQLDFTNSNGRMSVPVMISGGGPYHFIVDTGAQRTVISRELAGSLGLLRGPDTKLTAMTGTSDVGTVVIPLISVSTLGGTRIEAPSLESRNLGAPGMLGLDTLQGSALSIDFDRQAMMVSPSTRRSRKDGAMAGDIVVRAKSVFGQLIVTDASYHGQRVRVIVDTGSSITIGNMALRRRVTWLPRKQALVSLTGVTGETIDLNYTHIDRFQMGEVSIANLPIAFADAAPFRRFGLTTQPALMLGMDTLRLFKRVRIDFANREIRLSVARDLAPQQGMASEWNSIKL